MAISAADVKKLRETTGSGMMDCKKALDEANGDFEAAKDILRKKGIAVAAKRADRAASEGAVVSYIHDGRIGVLLEINSETDFVARTDKFQELATNIAMQIAASQPRWVSRDEVAESDLERERSILIEQAKAEGKPDNIAEKMVEGRMRKFYEEYCLLDQEYIRDDKVKIADLIEDFTGQVGEKIEVRRFVRYSLGEEL
ncbi:MAG TPA: translation elongation factor Ts [Armatimonadota bacterium]|jgi:elongation factor Ts|nr:translation elongation factor Ts [Armatimonadota bacterium]